MSDLLHQMGGLYQVYRNINQYNDFLEIKVLIMHNWIFSIPKSVYPNEVSLAYE